MKRTFSGELKKYRIHLRLEQSGPFPVSFFGPGNLFSAVFFCLGLVHRGEGFSTGVSGVTVAAPSGCWWWSISDRCSPEWPAGKWIPRVGSPPAPDSAETRCSGWSRPGGDTQSQSQTVRWGLSCVRHHARSDEDDVEGEPQNHKTRKAYRTLCHFRTWEYGCSEPVMKKLLINIDLALILHWSHTSKVAWMRWMVFFFF